ncbi:hypothetical protein ACGTJS_02285 [Faucicola mancuniensis]|uniref:hypothetical protein n=1 Tax=Faucicola mancuniensis TaxID=1309795 RepID=UPI003977C12E
MVSPHIRLYNLPLVKDIDPDIRQKTVLEFIESKDLGNLVVGDSVPFNDDYKLMVRYVDNQGNITAVSIKKHDKKTK